MSPADILATISLPSSRLSAKAGLADAVDETQVTGAHRPHAGARQIHRRQGHWQSAQGEIADLMNRLPKAVFSRTLASADWTNTRRIKGNAVEKILKLKPKGSGHLYFFGRADFLWAGSSSLRREPVHRLK